MVGSIHLRGEREVGSERDFFLICQPFASLRFKNLYNNLYSFFKNLFTKRGSVITAHSFKNLYIFFQEPLYETW